MSRYFIVFFLVSFFVSCGESQRTDSLCVIAAFEKEGEKVDLKYAKNFSIDSCSLGYHVCFFMPNDTVVVNEIYLLRDSSSLKKVPKECGCLSIPIRRLATNSTTHLEFLRLLGQLGSLCGVCNSEYIYSETIRDKIAEGKIVSLGNSMQINPELLLLSNPDLLLLSDSRETSFPLNCPVTITSEWLENSVLARAEWIKFFGLLFDDYTMSDSIFQSTEKNYESLKTLASNDSLTPTLFAAGSFGDTWYLTGGDAYMSQLYRDANTTFVLSDTMVGTVTCGLEWVLSHFYATDYWLNCQCDQYSELDYRLRELKSYQHQHVYNFNKRSVKRNGVSISDFYESGVAHPDWILADVISIVHPQLLPSYETVYIQNLK